MPDNAIWAVTGPEHDARMARELAWNLTGGQTGIIGPDSLEVRAQPVPSNTVRIMPGGMSIAATSQQANIGYTSAPWQSYTKAIYQPLDVEIQPTTSSGGRTDVVGIVIDDPEFEGTSPDPDAHQYWRTHVVQNAGNSATLQRHFASLGRPFLPLAQVRVPSSTATITESMIHDLRRMAIEKSHTVPFVFDANTEGEHYDIPASRTSWLGLAAIEDIAVPEWATQAKINATLTQAHRMEDSVSGQFRLSTTGSNGNFTTPATTFLEADPDWTRFDMHTAGTIYLHESTAGATCRIRPQIRRTNPEARPGVVRIPHYELSVSRVFGQITFEEAPRYIVDGA